LLGEAIEPRNQKLFCDAGSIRQVSFVTGRGHRWVSAAYDQRVPVRQIATVFIALIAILGAGLFVLSWGDDDNATTDRPSSGETAPDETGDEPASTTSPVTTTIVPVTTSIPLDCAPEPATEPTPDASPTTTTITTTTLAEGGDPAAETDPDLPLIPSLGRNSSISTVGLDEVTFGLTVNQATKAAGTEMHSCGPVTDCYRVVPADAPDGISFVVHEGTIERVDIVGDSPIATVSGAGIGTTVEQLDDLFGERLEKVDLGGGSEDIIFVPADENDQEFRVAFTAVDGVVESLRSGRVPLVLEANPCG
jgi:hypothetical protein